MSATSVLRSLAGEVVDFVVFVGELLGGASSGRAREAILRDLGAQPGAGGLVLPEAVHALRSRAVKTQDEIERELAEGDSELVAVVRGLEQQYDALAGAATRGSLVAEPVELPSAEELGEVFERFLAEREDDD